VAVVAKKKKEEKSFLPLLLPSLSTDDPGRAPRGWPRALFPLPPLLCRSALRSDDLASFSRGEEEGRGAEKAVKKSQENQGSSSTFVDLTTRDAPLSLGSTSTTRRR